MTMKDQFCDNCDNCGKAFEGENALLELALMPADLDEPVFLVCPGCLLAVARHLMGIEALPPTADNRTVLAVIHKQKRKNKG